MCYTPLKCIQMSAMATNSSLLQPRMYLEGDVQMQLFCLIVFLVLTQPLAEITKEWIALHPRLSYTVRSYKELV